MRQAKDAQNLTETIVAETASPPRDRSPPPELVTPEQIRRLLFDAVASGNARRLDALCDEHKATILRHGQDWLTVPEEFRANPDIYAWYGNGLRAIAQYCAEKLGHSELAERLKALPAAAG